MTAAPADYAVGSIVRARGRDWIVLPPEEPEVVRLRPLTGGDADTAGVLLGLEDAPRQSIFPPPDPAHAGDTAGALLLHNAARLSLRAGATPFRSLGRIAVTPRPYQFVPLLLALRQPVTRLLIADDVGVGKTVEAALIARELLDRGLAQRVAVLCPAHLCGQWHAELRDKVALDAAVVQPSTIGRLERELPRPDISLYQHYRHLVASIDFIKSDRNRGLFLHHAPDLIIVDEAHIAARPPGVAGRSQHQRYELVRDLARDPHRRLLLVTATPHSGLEESFRSLLGLLNPAFDGDAIEPLDKRRLLPYVIQRRRRSLRHWLGADTPFPDRLAAERTYTLSHDYAAFYEAVRAYCRESVADATGLRRQQQRVRYWAAVALLRCVLSSPAAAVAVLERRAERQGVAAEAEEATEAVDERYRPQVLDALDDEAATDYVPAAPLDDPEAKLSETERRKLAAFMRQARELATPERDRKLAETAAIVGELLRDGYHPIVFCRYVSSATYVAAQLSTRLAKTAKDLVVTAVTGEVGDEERQERIADLVTHPVRVLVATDCLSEGVNLQEHFDAVVHFDLPWNPNRLEQREGRVDRFGQTRKEVRTVVLYGVDNEIDHVVREVLLRKVRTIREQLGVSVPVPIDSVLVQQAVADAVLFSPPSRGPQRQLELFPSEASRIHQQIDRQLDEAAKRERDDQTFFAQHAISPDEVQRELDAIDPVLGDADAVRRFVGETLQRLGGALRPAKPAGVYAVEVSAAAAVLAARGVSEPPALVAFTPVQGVAATEMGRTSPLVAALAGHVLGAALGPQPDPRFPRCGAVVTTAVQTRTAVLLLRLRYVLTEEREEFAEEVVLAVYRWREDGLVPVEPDGGVAALLERVTASANLSSAERTAQVRWALDLLAATPNWWQDVAEERKAALQAAHDRIRALAQAPPLSVQTYPPDILGCFVLVPGGQ